MDLKIIRKTEQITTSWSGGTTTQLFIYPEDASYRERNFLFRISTATVETEESEFTRLPGISRKIMILDGILKLEHKDKYTKTLHKFEIDAFSGDWETRGFGKVTDFNLMTIGKVEGSLSVKFLNKDESLNALQVNPHQSFGIYALKGKLLTKSDDEYLTVGEKDFLWVSCREKNSEINISAIEDSELIIARINLPIG